MGSDLLKDAEPAGAEPGFSSLCMAPLTSSPMLAVVGGPEQTHPHGCRQLQGKQAFLRAS